MSRRPLKTPVVRGRAGIGVGVLAMGGYRPCPGVGFVKVGGGAGGTGATGYVGGVMWPSMGARAEASRMAPMTMKRIGKVLTKDKEPWRSSLRRKRIPRV